MQPDLMLCRDSRDFSQRVNGPRVGSASGSDNRHNLLAVSLSLGDFRFQVRHVHPRELVGFHQRHGTVAEAHQRHILLHREVGIFRTQYFVATNIARQTILLDGVALAGKEGIARQHQPHHVALGTAAGEHARIASAVADLRTQPFNQLDLNDGG